MKGVVLVGEKDMRVQGVAMGVGGGLVTVLRNCGECGVGRLHRC